MHRKAHVHVGRIVLAYNVPNVTALNLCAKTVSIYVDHFCFTKTLEDLLVHLDSEVRVYPALIDRCVAD